MLSTHAEKAIWPETFANHSFKETKTGFIFGEDKLHGISLDDV